MKNSLYFFKLLLKFEGNSWVLFGEESLTDRSEVKFVDVEGKVMQVVDHVEVVIVYYLFRVGGGEFRVDGVKQG